MEDFQKAIASNVWRTDEPTGDGEDAAGLVEAAPRSEEDYVKVRKILDKK